MPVYNDRRKEYNTMRNKFTEFARELFGRYGFKKTTMDDIARAAGKTKSSIYYYFKNKEEILQAVAHIEIRKGIDELLKAVSTKKSADEKLAAYIRARIYAKQSIASFYRFIGEEYFENYRFIVKIRVELDKEEFAIIGNILKEGIKQKVFSIRDANLAAMNLLNIFKGLEYYYLNTKDSKKLQKEVDSMITLFLQGLLRR